MSSCVACGAPVGEVGVACGLCGTVRQPEARGISLSKESIDPDLSAPVQPTLEQSVAPAFGRPSGAGEHTSSQAQSWQMPPRQDSAAAHAAPIGPLGSVFAPAGLRSAVVFFAIAAGLGLLSAFPAVHELQGVLEVSDLRTPAYLYPVLLSTVAAVLFTTWAGLAAWSAGRGRPTTGWSAAVLALLAVMGVPGWSLNSGAMLTARLAALGGCAALIVARRSGHAVGGEAVPVLRTFQLSVTGATTAAALVALTALPRVSSAGAGGVFTLLLLVASAIFGWIAHRGMRRPTATDSRVYATGAVIGLFLAVLLCPSGVPRPVAFTAGSALALSGMLWLVPQCREWFGDARTTVVPVPDQLRAFVRPAPPATAPTTAPTATASTSPTGVGASASPTSPSAGYVALTRSGWNRAVLASAVCVAVAVVGVMARRPGSALLIDLALTLWLAGVVFARAWVPSVTGVVVGMTSAAMNIARPSGGTRGDGSAVVGAERRLRTAAAMAAPLAVGLMGALVVGSTTVDREQLCSSYQATSAQLSGYSDSAFFAAVSKLGEDASAYDGKDVDSATTDSIHSAGSRLTALAERQSVYVYEARSAMAPIGSVCIIGGD